MQKLDQRDRDRQRLSYIVLCPGDLSADSINEWMWAISGRTQGGARFTGVHTIAFEVWATRDGITHRLKVPWQQAESVIPQLQGLVPGIRVTPDYDPPRMKWTRAVELGLTNPGRPLRIDSAERVSTSLLKSIDHLDAGETVMMQLIVTPASRGRKPVYKEARSDLVSWRHLANGNLANRDEVKERRDKLDEPNMLAVIRLGAVAGTENRARHLLHDGLGRTLASVHSPTTRFRPRMVSRSTLQDSIDRAAGMARFPIQLSVSECAALVAWPIGNPVGVTGLPKPTGRQFPPHGAIQSEGLIIGDAAWPGRERPVAIGFHESTMHTDVIGKTGTGKTVLLGNMARQIMQAGHGLIVMEMEGNLYQAALNYVPEERIKDVILLDVGDTHHPVGFNILDQGNPLNVIDEVIALMQHKYGGSNPDIWLQEYIYHGLRTIAERPNLTVVELVNLLSPMTSAEVQWVEAITRSIKDPEIKRWWQGQDNRGKNDQQKRAGPVLSRWWQLTSRPELRHILGQSKSAFQLRDVLQENKILLINLKGVAADTASLFGTMMTQAIWRAVREVKKDRLTYLMYDEFGDYMDMPIGLDSMLAQARKHKLPMILAHQDNSQLNKEFKEAVITNTRNKIIFESKSDDASLIARELGGRITPEDVTGLPNYEAIASVLTPIGPSGPVSITTRRAAPLTGVAKDVYRYSRERYSRPVVEVRREMEQRFQPEARPGRPRPKVSGGDFWDAETL